MIRRGALAGLGALMLSACAGIIGLGDLDVVQRAADGAPPAPNDALAPSVDVGTEPLPDAPIAKLMRPAAGTFTFEPTTGGSVGSEATSPHPYGIVYGATATVVVAHEGENCLRLTLKPRSNYDEVLTLCVEGSELVQKQFDRDQLFPFARIKVDVTCKPGEVYFVDDPAPGQTWLHDCEGTLSDAVSDPKFATRGTYRFEGEKSVPLDPPVNALHFHEERTLNGSQEGTYFVDFYFTRAGQLVRFVRDIDVTYTSKTVGSIRYTEKEDMKLKKGN